MKTKVSILFYAKKAKAAANGLVPIYTRITINGKRICCCGINPYLPRPQQQNKRIVGKEYAPGTLERYTTSLKHTIEFMQWKYNVSDIDITKIDHAFITDYEFWLRSVRNCANNTAVKYLKNFNKIIKLCLANDWLDKNPFANYKSKVKEVERVYLTEAEIQSIIEKDFKTERLVISSRYLPF
jgi:site-specific recombinase XerD